jgi:VWFA-related protein
MDGFIQLDFMRRLSPFLAAIIVVAAAVPASTQGTRGLPPPMTLPDVQPQRPDRPVFRTSVTRVEVSALVLDRNGTPVRGLTANDFEVLENGVPQIVRSFIPFTYQPDVLVLPDPVLEGGEPLAPPPSMPASNYYTSASRVFALILDDLHVDVRRTKAARAAARRLVEQLTPADLLFVTTTGSAESTGYFSRDRRHALQMIDGFTGHRLLDKTMVGLRFPGENFEAERLDNYERLCRTIRDVSLGLRDVAGRRKTVILISEGSSFGAGMSDMTVTMPTATNGERANVPTGSLKWMNEALAAAAAGNVAIYPLNPAGLDVPEADLIQVQGLPAAPGVPETVMTELLTEARQAKEMSRDLAALTGGVSLVDSNNVVDGIDRAVRDASSHYVLSYEPGTAPKRNEYRQIEVKVRRPGLRVLARRGYRVAEAPAPPPMSVPASLTPQLRTLLAAVLPDDALPMRVQAVPLARNGKMTTVAVIVEVNGSAFGERPDRGLQIEQGLLTMNVTGKAANGTRRIFDISLSTAQREVLAATGLRSVWAIDLPAGRHQVRVASIDSATRRGGAVYLDVDLPSGSGALPPAVLVASRFLSAMPTVFSDQRLSAWTSAMPTATRVFPEGDLLTVTVPHSGTAPATARLTNASGKVVWEGSGATVEGASAARFVLPLEHVGSPVCELTVESSSGVARTTIGILSLQPK